MAELLINNWGWIGDDSFLTRNWECFDMDGIDVITTPRKISAQNAFLQTYATTNPWSWTFNDAKESIDWLVHCYSNNVCIDWWDLSALVAGAEMSVSIGGNLSDYNSTSNPDGVRHFFFTQDGTNNPIKVVWYSAGSRAVLATINTSGGAAPADIPAWFNNKVTAACYLWKGAIIFARGSKIYEVNPTTNILATGAKVELPIGASVKWIHYYNGFIYFVYTLNGSTYIHGCTYDGTNYKLTTYSDKKSGELCYSSWSDAGSIYWISSSGIFQFNGVSVLIKKLSLSSSARISYNKWVIKVIDWTNYYELGVNKPWYGVPLTKQTLSLTIKWVTESKIITFNGSSTYYIDSNSSTAYKRTNTYTFHPYTGGQFWWIKKWTWILVGIDLPKLASYTSSSTVCSVKISAQTDLMYQSNTSLYADLYEETDETKRYIEIMPTQIAKALWDLGYSDEYWYIRFKITLYAGDPYASYWNTIYRKTPEVYDFYLNHEFVKNSFK